MSLVRTAEYGLIVSDGGFFQTSFVASPPGSDLVSIFLAVLNNPHALSAEYARLGYAVWALDEVHIYAGLGFTACVLLFLSPFRLHRDPSRAIESYAVAIGAIVVWCGGKTRQRAG